jgi:hypothetical protein
MGKEKRRPNDRMVDHRVFWRSIILCGLFFSGRGLLEHFRYFASGWIWFLASRLGVKRFDRIGCDWLLVPRSQGCYERRAPGGNLS